MHFLINIHFFDFTSKSPFMLSQQLVQKQGDGLQIFIGNTVRASFIIFIPALLLTAAYSICNTHTHMYSCTKAYAYTQICCVSLQESGR